MLQPQPWERQPGETAKQYSAFCLYREHRSIRGALRAKYDSLSRMARWGVWSRHLAWVDRLAAWDAERERVKRDAELEELKTLAKQQAQEARALAAGLVYPVRVFLQRLQADPKKVEAQLSKMDLIELLKLNARCAQAIALVHQAERRAKVGGDGELPRVDDDSKPLSGPIQRIEMVYSEWPDGRDE